MPVSRMLVGIALGGVLLFGLGSMVSKVACMASYPALNDQSQNATSLIAQDIRRASSVQSANGHQLVLAVRHPEGSSTVTYNYDEATRTLTRTDNAGAQTILTEVDSFAFSLLRKPASDAAYSVLAPATADSAKLVGCSWSCSRKLAGTKVDSETIQIAPVVLRNRC